MKEANGWLNAETIVDNECKKYVNTTLGVTTDKIRSMRLEDVESIISGFVNTWYGKEYTPTDQSQGMLARKSTGGKTFDGYNEQIYLTKNGNLTIVHTEVGFNSDYLRWSIVDSNAKEVSDYGDIIGKGSSWLASRTVYTDGRRALFYVKILGGSGVNR